jgi:hypothetical protein
MLNHERWQANLCLENPSRYDLCQLVLVSKQLVMQNQNTKSQIPYSAYISFIAMYKVNILEINMNETELPIRLAQLALDSKQASLFSDLIKIGLPSLVAIVSAFITLKVSTLNAASQIKITKNNNNYDKKIALIKIEHEKNLLVNDRSNAIAKELAENVTIGYEAIRGYTYQLNGLVHAKSEGRTPSQYNFNQVSTEYTASTRVYDSVRSKIKTAAMLIGNTEITTAVNAFERSILDILAKCTSNTELPLNEIFDYTTKFESVTDSLFNKLGVYLSIQS